MSLSDETFQTVESLKWNEQLIFMIASAERLFPLLFWLDDKDTIQFAERYLETAWTLAISSNNSVRSVKWNNLIQELNIHLNQPSSDLIGEVFVERYIYILKYIYQKISGENADEAIINLLHIIMDTLGEIDHHLNYYLHYAVKNNLKIQNWGSVRAKEISEQWEILSILLKKDLTLHQKVEFADDKSKKSRSFVNEQVMKMQSHNKKLEE